MTPQNPGSRDPIGTAGTGPTGTRTTPPTGTPTTGGRTEGMMSDTAHEARRKSHERARQAKAKAGEAFDENKQRAVGQLGSVSNALRSTASRLHEEEQHQIEDLLDRAADGLDRARTLLQTKDLNELIGDTEKVARRHPGAFIGGAVALGFVAARFLKSSQQRSFEGNRSGWSEGPQRGDTLERGYTSRDYTTGFEEER
jgi:ElaB/YqjD/DUF883 family membrane-anchored ribosome-binding protein